MNALLKAVESLGGRVAQDVMPSEPTWCVYLCGERAAKIRLREPGRREKDLKSPYGGVVYVPTGNFVLENGPSTCGAHCRDGKRVKIEEKINATLKKWIIEVGEARIRKRERLAGERARQERLRAREDHILQQEQERARLGELLEQVGAWEQSRALRAYVRRVQTEGHPSLSSRETAEWSRWASEQADRLDPLVKSPPSILDIEPPGGPSRAGKPEAVTDGERVHP